MARLVGRGRDARSGGEAPAGAALRALAVLALASLVVGCLVLGFGERGASASGGHGGVSVVAAAPAQGIEGFGASGDWWVEDLAHFPPAAQDHVADLLFTTKGIELSQYRFNIGGGGVGVTAGGGPDESQFGARTRAPGSFYKGPGTFDWGADPGGVAFLEDAARDGVPDIEADVNSAPAAFTSNHRSCGGSLLAGGIGGYADFLTAVVSHARSAWGAEISQVSPMNEPGDSFPSCTQEGMSVPSAEQGALVRTLAHDLAQRAPFAHVMADESAGVSNFVEGEEGWLPQTHLGTVAVHGYDWPSDATWSRAREAAGSRSLWETEICCSRSPGGMPGASRGYDPEMASALRVSGLIWQALTYGHVSAWDWWLAASPAVGGCKPFPACASVPNPVGYDDGLLYYDPDFLKDGDFQVYETKRFWAMGNWSRFVRPGSVMHPVSGAPAGVRLAAFATPTGWSVVAMNDGAAPASTTLDFPGGPLRPDGAYRTSAGEDLASVGDAFEWGSHTFSIDLAPQSVTTFLFSPAPSGPAATRDGAGTEVIAATAPGGNVVVTPRTPAGTWGPATDLGGRALGAPAVVPAGPGRFEVIVEGTDHAAWATTYQPGSRPSRWSSLGGRLSAPPGAAAEGSSVEVLARGTDGALWVRPAGPGRWRRLGGVLARGDAPSGVYTYPGNLDVFARGTDGAVWERAWWGWSRVGGAILGGPGSSSLGPGEVGVFARGLDGAIWHRRWQRESGWSSWASLGGRLASGPAPAGSSGASTGDQDVYATGGDGALWAVRDDGGRWGAWTRVAGSWG